MNSTEKVWMIVEQLQDTEDSELREQLGLGEFPPSVLRFVLAGAAEQLPDDPNRCDEMLEQFANFLLSLRSDEEPAVTP